MFDLIYSLVSLNKPHNRLCKNMTVRYLLTTIMVWHFLQLQLSWILDLFYLSTHFKLHTVAVNNIEHFSFNIFCFSMLHSSRSHIMGHLVYCASFRFYRLWNICFQTYPMYFFVMFCHCSFNNEFWIISKRSSINAVLKNCKINTRVLILITKTASKLTFI